MSLTVERLRELLEYSPETGLFVWKIKRKKMNPGDAAGSIVQKRYRNICLDKKTYLAHRLAWLYIHGKWPKGWVDHINHDRFDNRMENLREVTPTQSAWNRRGDKGRSLPKGVYFKPNGGRCFESWIMCSGEHHYLGRFYTANDASIAYQKASTTLHRKFAGGLS